MILIYLLFVEIALRVHGAKNKHNCTNASQVNKHRDIAIDQNCQKNHPKVGLYFAGIDVRIEESIAV